MNANIITRSVQHSDDLFYDAFHNNIMTLDSNYSVNSYIDSFMVLDLKP